MENSVFLRSKCLFITCTRVFGNVSVNNILYYDNHDSLKQLIEVLILYIKIDFGLSVW
jgi:hypothetical protein